MNDDELLRRIGRIAKERDEGLDDEAAGVARDDVAHSRIADQLARELLGRRRRPATWVYASAGGVALAAAAALLLVRPADDALPLYAASAPAVRTMRGPEATPDGRGCELTLTEKGEVVVELTPASAVRGPVHAHAWVVGDGAPSAWPGTMEVSSQGAVRLEAEARALRGAREVVVVVARREGRLTLDASGADVRRLTCAVRTP